MYFFSVTGIDNLSFSVTIPTQVLATAVAVGHEFPFQRYVTSGTDVVSMTIREHHYFSNWKFHAVFCKVHEQMPEKRRRKGYIRRCVLRNSRRFFHASPAAYSHHLNSSGNKSANSHVQKLVPVRELLTSFVSLNRANVAGEILSDLVLCYTRL